MKPPRVAYYDGIDAPVGRVWLAMSEAGLVRISFRQNETNFVAELEHRLGTTAVRSPEKMKGVVHQLRDYFAGRRRSFDMPTDLGGVTPFQRRVLMATLRVPAGQTASYGDIARRIGRRRGSRAVGQALGRNPVPIVIPCHRVVGADGALGGYTGGLDIKKKLLQLEGALAGSRGTAVTRSRHEAGGMLLRQMPMRSSKTEPK